MIEIVNNCKGSLPPGFFSNFLIVLDWIHNSIYTNEEIFINWNCGSDFNIWDRLFEQPNFMENNLDKIVVNQFRNFYDKKYTHLNINDIIPIYQKYNGYFCNNFKIFFEPEFQNVRNEFNKAFNTLRFKEDISNQVKEYEKKFNGKVLGAAVRIPLHYTKNKPEGIPISADISPEEFYDKIALELIDKYEKLNYDKIFLACDVNYFLNKIIEKIGEEKIIYTKYNRVSELNADWNKKNLSFYDEYRLVLIDCLLLSKCNYILGGSSNVFLAALYFNVELKYEIFKLLDNLYGC